MAIDRNRPRAMAGNFINAHSVMLIPRFGASTSDRELLGVIKLSLLDCTLAVRHKTRYSSRQQRFVLRSSLSSTHDVITATPFDHNVHHRGFWPKQLMAV